MDWNCIEDSSLKSAVEIICDEAYASRSRDVIIAHLQAIGCVLVYIPNIGALTVYHGDLKNGVPHGKGTMVYLPECRYLHVTKILKTPIQAHCMHPRAKPHTQIFSEIFHRAALCTLALTQNLAYMSSYYLGNFKDGARCGAGKHVFKDYSRNGCEYEGNWIVLPDGKTSQMNGQVMSTRALM